MEAYFEHFFKHLNPIVSLVAMIAGGLTGWKMFTGIWGYIHGAIDVGIDLVFTEPTTSMTPSEISQYRALVRMSGSEDEKASLLSLSDQELVAVVAPHLDSMRTSKHQIKKSIAGVGATYFILWRFPWVNMTIGMSSIFVGLCVSVLVAFILQLTLNILVYTALAAVVVGSPFLAYAGIKQMISSYREGRN